jgi:8-oxo-dGTP pyrophosphatase MutT (NUDIX family)
VNLDSKTLVTLRQRLAENKPKAIVGEYRDAAVLVAIAHVDGEHSVVLTRRAMHLNLHPGEAAFPGGKKDPEDKTLLLTALREANEEVGLSPESFELLGELDQKVTRSSIKVTPFVGLIPDVNLLSANQNELDCIYTVPLHFFLNRKNLSISQAEYQGRLRDVARFEYQGHSIWGVTASIIVDLLNTVFDVGIKLNR